MTEYTYLRPKQIYEGKEYPITKGQIRGFLLNRKTNGLHICVRKIGKSILIRKDLFDKWLESFEEKHGN